MREPVPIERPTLHLVHYEIRSARPRWLFASEPREPVRHITPVPTLDEIADDPARVRALLAPAVEALLAACHVAQAALLGRLLALRASPASDAIPTEDEAVDIEEASRILSMKKGTLYRLWKSMNIGYRDADGRVKFRRVALQRYLTRKGG